MCDHSSTEKRHFSSTKKNCIRHVLQHKKIQYDNNKIVYMHSLCVPFDRFMEAINLAFWWKFSILFFIATLVQNVYDHRMLRWINTFMFFWFFFVGLMTIITSFPQSNRLLHQLITTLLPDWLVFLFFFGWTQHINVNIIMLITCSLHYV